MKLKRTLPAVAAIALGMTTLAACGSGGGSSSHASSKEVVVYTADGLNDGDSSFYHQVFAKFKAQTGIKVSVVEAGSGEVLQRVKQEQGNTQADLLVTLPPFIQNADTDGLLTAYTPKGTDHVPATDKASDGTYYAMINNYLCMIRNTKKVPTAPGQLSDLLDSKYKNLLQYSTPGVAGDGTAFLLLVRNLLGDQATSYVTKLQDNNVGPSESTGQLAAKVDKGELTIANGDVQMNYAQSATMPNLGIFFPKDSSGTPTTVSLPYDAGLVKGAPHSANAKKLLDFLYSDTVQEMATTVAGGFPARDDIKPTGKQADDLAALMKGVKVVNLDWDQVAKDLNSIVDDYNKATGTL